MRVMRWCLVGVCSYHHSSILESCDGGWHLWLSSQQHEKGMKWWSTKFNVVVIRAAFWSHEMAAGKYGGYHKSILAVWDGHWCLQLSS